MKRNVLTIFLLACNILLFCQEREQKIYNANQIQGIWQMYANYTDANDNAFYKVYHIFKGRKCLDVDITGSPYDKLSVVVSDYGFSDYDMYDDLSLENITDSGEFFIEIVNENGRRLFNVSSPFQLEEKKSLIIFNDECDYIDKAPKEVLDVLYKRGMRDHRDYIKEFLDMQVCGIKAEKSFIYDSTQAKTKMYLVKDDIVTVNGQQNGFMKMEYETAKGDTIRGLVRKEDVECIEASKSVK